MASSKKAGIMSMAGLQRSAATLRRFLPAAIWRPLGALANGIVTPIRFSLATGHWKSSIAMSARAADGTPLPWYTYPAIDFLAQRDFKNCNVLEFGGGQSTLWWSAKARSVLTIERDAAWFARLRSQVGPNVSLHHIPVDRVTRTIQPVIDLIAANPTRKFDIIVVDGHLRQEVAALAFDYLAPLGAIILDNAEGYGFYAELQKRPCRRIDFFGFAPGVPRRHCTSVVFVEDCFLLGPDIPIPVIEGTR
ncbi:MAG TPA: hypothetical protein VK777_08990 [Reyranella sp.]|jgi:hypothetical protein|nr:hypothetical protein [Reyranella sp.]